MQLSKIINFHKAVTDPTRIRIIMLLANSSQSGIEIAERLGISAPTVTHHANKLRDAGLLYQRREKNTIYFSLDEKTLKQSSLALLKLVEQAKEGEDGMSINTEVQLKNSVITNFFSKDGRLKQIPAQMKKKLIVLEHIVEELEQGKKYQEKELNEFIKQFHDDYATLRREFIIHQFMYREDSVYELNPKELWTKWDKLS
ncbi:metalloregulator ArsR/SmtB family transcription factor [Bacillus suaedaesalsae]|uniref:Metalloregulator ArsR/SmtB family transcription factor n=1 Tax=Bacillus suaedaesalsae TaxID=2810349 RepID=A0ABS2DDG0_9BACI|nr:metalloregulator ArsR/SmtB family transcription factor [Bacillus suaedaesalsae]MBM6616495.1 metalloregulator ArsR/SmtB family transcription factor [Bacillus suaedaesalsae]